MRFSYQVGMCDPGHYLPLAQAAEAAGFDGITIPDSIRAIFAGLGSSEIADLTYQDMWIMYGKIGFPEETREFVVPGAEPIAEIIERFYAISPERRLKHESVVMITDTARSDLFPA